MKNFFVKILIVSLLLSFSLFTTDTAADTPEGYWKLNVTAVNKGDSVTEDMVKANSNILNHSYEIHPGGGSMSTTTKNGDNNITIKSTHAFSVPDTLVPGETVAITLGVADAGSSNSSLYISHSTGMGCWVNTGGTWQTYGSGTVATGIFVTADNPAKELTQAEKTIEMVVPGKADAIAIHFSILGGYAPGSMVINYDYSFVEGDPVQTSTDTDTSKTTSDTEPPREDSTTTAIEPNMTKPKTDTVGNTAELPQEKPQKQTYWDSISDMHDRLNEDAGCIFSDLSGQIEIYTPSPDDPNEENWEFAKIDTVLRPGMKIRTGLDSSAVLSFADMSTFVMKPNTTIILSPATKKENKLTLAAGNIWVNVKKMVIDGTMDIEMSQGSLGIKGTIFVCEEDGNKSTLMVIEGDVAFTDKNTGEMTHVTAGQTITAGQSATPLMNFDIKQEHASWLAYAPDLAITNKNILLPGINLVIIGTSILTILIILIAIITVIKHKKAVTIPYYPSEEYNAGSPASYSTNSPVNNSINSSGMPQPQGLFCSQCGNEIREEAKFCSKCGSSLVQMEIPNNLIGFSPKIDDPAFLSYKNKSKAWSFIFALILSVIAIAGFPIYGNISGEVDWPYSLYYGFAIGGMFILIALLQTIKRGTDKTWDGVVADKQAYTRKERTRNGRWVNHAIYEIKIKKDSGGTKKHKWTDTQGLYNYYNIGDRLRHHKGFLYYEKYDKSQDSQIMCAACMAFNDIAGERCVKCKCPLLK